MANLVQWARRGTRGAAGPSPWPSITLDQLPYWFGQFGYQGLGYGPTMIQTIQQNREYIAADFMGFINGAFKTNGAVFACIMARAIFFSEARFQFRRLNNGRPGILFGTPALDILEHPWPNATTGDLLMKALLDIDMAGNFYAARMPRLDRKGSKIVRLRPDWVTILKGTQQDSDLTQTWDPNSELLGYIYTPGGPGSPIKPWMFLPEEVAHCAPIPDPVATYRGMSWVQPILTEVLGDRSMSTHKLMYFEAGACLTLDSVLATPTGWTTMGEVAVDDQVIGANGQPTRVLGVYDRGEKDVYRVTFTGGVSVECDEDHLWQVQGYQQRTGNRSGQIAHEVISLRTILERGVRYPSGPHKFSIPLTAPVEYDDPGPLPLDPYLLGTFLGDGHAARYVGIAAHTDDTKWLRSELVSMVPSALLTIEENRRPGTHATELRFSRRNGTARENWLMGKLRDLRLAEVVHHEKSVPELYMRASVEDRVALLQGLLDTDGSVEGTAVRFCSTSQRLVAQVVELAESLGGVASIARRARKAGRVQWVARLSRFPEGIVPLRLPRKREKYRLSQRAIDRTRFIHSVELVGRKPVRCIKVEAPDGLYLTNDFIVTHNTPNLVVSMDTGKMDRDTFAEWIELFENEHSGSLNAWKTLYLGQGAQASVVGSNLKDLDYASVQGITEVRIAAAARVPPIVAGFKYGLDSGTHENFHQAVRLFSDGCVRPLWRNFCGSMETLVPPPRGAQLWYDDRDIAYLQEDEQDEAKVLLTKSTAMRLLVDAGFEPDSVVEAIENNDLSRLKHSKLYSVQLQPPGTGGQGAFGGSGGNGNGNGNSNDGSGQNTASMADWLLASGRGGSIPTDVTNVEQLAKALLSARAGDDMSESEEFPHGGHRQVAQRRR